MKKISVFVTALLAAATMWAQNPYLPLWEHLPDGEPRAPVEDLSQWRDEGILFSWFVDGQWDTMYAPDLVEVRDRVTGKKTYYLYPHSRGRGRIATVCKSDRPDGPFVPVNVTEDGRGVLPGSLIDFDPSVFIETITDKKDPDYGIGYRAYVYYGFQHSTACELDQNTMYSMRPGTELHDYFIPASSQYGQVRDPEGTQYPALYKGQNPGDFNFFEASSIRKVGNKYVMVFSGYSGPDYGLSSTNSALRYAFGDSPLGPWRSGGVLVDSRGVVPDENGEHLTTSNAAHNTHGSLQEINGQWYVFYHRPPRGFGNARQSMVAPVKIEWDNKKVADGGQLRITGYDPYAKDEVWTASAADGTVYTGAEVTSEGFQVFGLPPYAYYSAGYACYLSDQDWMQDNHDVWCNDMDVAGVTNVDLYLTPGRHGAFKIHVMLDGPYANATWKGREIAVVEVPDGKRGELLHLTVPVPAVEGLSGKHAIFLVAEGADIQRPQMDPRFAAFAARNPRRPDGLFDLHGIGFSKPGAPCVRPTVPQVKIFADGKELAVPATPVRFTNANGIMDQLHYQVYAPLKDGSVLQVSASDPDVRISTGPVVNGRATVKCCWKGLEKTYWIN